MTVSKRYIKVKVLTSDTSQDFPKRLGKLGVTVQGTELFEGRNESEINRILFSKPLEETKKESLIYRGQLWGPIIAGAIGGVVGGAEEDALLGLLPDEG